MLGRNPTLTIMSLNKPRQEGKKFGDVMSDQQVHQHKKLMYMEKYYKVHYRPSATPRHIHYQ